MTTEDPDKIERIEIIDRIEITDSPEETIDSPEETIDSQEERIEERKEEIAIKIDQKGTTIDTTTIGQREITIDTITKGPADLNPTEHTTSQKAQKGHTTSQKETEHTIEPKGQKETITGRKEGTTTELMIRISIEKRCRMPDQGKNILKRGNRIEREEPRCNGLRLPISVQPKTNSTL